MSAGPLNNSPRCSPSADAKRECKVDENGRKARFTFGLKEAIIVALVGIAVAVAAAVAHL